MRAPPTTLCRAHNFGLNLFWCFWWPASFFAYPFVGRVWCAGEVAFRVGQGMVGQGYAQWPASSFAYPFLGRVWCADEAC